MTPDVAGSGGPAAGWEHAPVALLTTDADGVVVAANRALAVAVGRDAASLVGRVRLSDLLTIGGRIYWETHLGPLLTLQGHVEEVAVELRGPDGRVPVLLSATVRDGGALVDVALLGSQGRLRYEQELLAARAAADAASARIGALHRQSAVVAHELQRALLTTAVPPDGRFVLSTEYRPGVRTLEVGGDWYDAFLLSHDRLLVVVGDVVGRGLAAATTMGQLRSALRAVAGPTTALPEVLRSLDDFVTRTGVGYMTTLAVAELHLATGDLRWVSAGHLPGVLVALGGPDAGSARLLWEGRSLPLGVSTAERPADEGRARLAPGDALVLYTDGLVERRDRGLAHGLEILRRAAEARLADRDGAGRAPGLADELATQAGERDDVCVLFLEWTGPVPG